MKDRRPPQLAAVLAVHHPLAKLELCPHCDGYFPRTKITSHRRGCWYLRLQRETRIHLEATILVR